MKTKTTLLIAALSLTAIAAPPATLRLVWEPSPDPVDVYCVYERAGTNWLKVATVTTTNWTFNTSLGLHVYSVTASNTWGESDFCEPASYRLATPPGGLKVVR